MLHYTPASTSVASPRAENQTRGFWGAELGEEGQSDEHLPATVQSGRCSSYSLHGLG